MGKSKKAAGSAGNAPSLAPLPKIPWTANQHAITWSLISEMEKTENRKVLFGKRTDEVRVEFLSYIPLLIFRRPRWEELISGTQDLRVQADR